MASQYHFITRWRFKAAADDLYSIISQPLEYPRWWPSVYLMVRVTGPGSVRVLTRGWLPYVIRWDAQSVAEQRPERLEIRASGEFEGRGIWSIVQEGEFADVTFDWKLSAQKPLLRYLSFVLRPAFEANHRWAMEQGRKSLQLELARFGASTVEEMNLIPAAPCASDLIRRDIVAGAIFSAAVTAALWRAQS